jgi:quinol monooxygenase YgiN
VAQVSVIAKLIAKEGKRDELVEQLSKLVVAAQDEPGTLVYSLNVSTTEPDVVYFFELYADQQALDVHGKSDAFKAAGAGMGDLLGGRPELYMCELAAAKGLPT